MKNILLFIRNEFKVLDQLLIGIIFLGLCLIVAGALVLTWRDLAELMLASGQSLSEWTGLFLLLRHGSIVQSKYWRYIVLSLTVVVMSFIFRILHLPGAMELFLVGFLLLELVYTIRFVRQPRTSTTGWLKYLWISSWCVATVGVAIDKIAEEWTLIPAVLFWATVVLFMNEKMDVARKVEEG